MTVYIEFLIPAEYASQKSLVHFFFFKPLHIPLPLEQPFPYVDLTQERAAVRAREVDQRARPDDVPAHDVCLVEHRVMR